MSSYTILTVFENTDTINEPVMSLPLLGKLSFRQIGIVIGLSILTPLMVYTAASESILDMWPDPAFSLDITDGNHMLVTWDIILAAIPAPFGLGLGIPRPKLMPMDRLVLVLAAFAVRRTSIQSTGSAKPIAALDAKPKNRRRNTAKSRFVGFAQKDTFATQKKIPKKKTFPVGVHELGVPKDITITLYDTRGNPMRNKLARAYIDGMLLSSITTDSDGVLGMVFAPKSEGVKNLTITVDGITKPVVDVGLDVTIQR